MALTKEFRETVYARAQRDASFRKALLTEAVNAYLSGDEMTGKAVLRDVINATVGFERLAVAMQKPSKSLQRMLGPWQSEHRQLLFNSPSASEAGRGEVDGASCIITDEAQVSRALMEHHPAAHIGRQAQAHCSRRRSHSVPWAIS
jgi:hypothetical protein